MLQRDIGIHLMKSVTSCISLKNLKIDLFSPLRKYSKTLKWLNDIIILISLITIDGSSSADFFIHL